MPPLCHYSDMHIPDGTCQMKWSTHGLNSQHDCDVSDRNVKLGDFETLYRIANTMIDSGVWESVWIFTSGSDSSINATHPGNPYWSGDSEGWHWLDE